MTESKYQELEIDKIILDYQNPRIAQYIEIYGDNISAEAISLALGSGAEDKNATTYASLEESIRINNGVIHPIIVNFTDANGYTVIEGNTRVQIYRDFKARGVSGDWDTIRAIVYTDLGENDIDAIRLQSHLVGPRDWDPYSKAKYLNYLSSQQRLPMPQLVSFCGGKANEVKIMIQAYNDMEEYYRKNLADDNEFDPKKFSAFAELQNRKIYESLAFNKFSKNDFALWVINGNIDKMAHVRQLPSILNNKDAKAVFLKKNASEAIKMLVITEAGGEKSKPYNQLAAELVQEIENMPYGEVKLLRNDEEYGDKKLILLELLEALESFVEEIKD